MTIHNVLLKHLAPHHDICYYSGEIRFFYHDETKDQQSFKDILWSSCKVNWLSHWMHYCFCAHFYHPIYTRPFERTQRHSEAL